MQRFTLAAPLHVGNHAIQALGIDRDVHEMGRHVAQMPQVVQREPGKPRDLIHAQSEIEHRLNIAVGEGLADVAQCLEHELGVGGFHGASPTVQYLASDSQSARPPSSPASRRIARQWPMSSRSSARVSSETPGLLRNS